MSVNGLVGVLALIVSAQYLVIAFNVVPRLARLARAGSRAISVARWGAASFFIGCAFTHLGIALTSFFPTVMSPEMTHGAVGSGTGLQIIAMVIPHIAQIVGGALFILIAHDRLEVSILSKSTAQGRRALDRQWRAAFNDAPFGIALLPVNGDTGSGDSYVNAAYTSMFGPTGGDDSTGLLASMPVGTEESRTALAQLSVGETVQRELELDTEDGTRLIHATLTPVSDKRGIQRVTGIFEDITLRAEAQAALRAREERFRRLADGLGAGLSLRQIDPPAFVYANSQYLELLGQSPDSFDGDSPSIIDGIHPDDRDALLTDYSQSVQRGVRATSTVRYLLPGGEMRWLRVISNPVSATEVVSIIEDVTAATNAEAAVRSAQAEAERANLAKSEFLSRMSHELRTPLNAVIGFGQLLKLGTLTPKQDEAVNHILGGGRHLLGMIDDILDISRIETDQLEVSIEAVCPGEVIDEAVALILPMAAHHQVSVEVLPPADGVGTVSADRRRLRQVLLNLLSNAVKYNRPQGTVTVTCTPYDDTQVAIAVTDTGIGIDGPALARLFVPFDRLGQEATEIEGTGIGLALSQRLAAIMGGRVEVASTHGSGSTFTVILPVAATTTPDAVAALPTPDDPAGRAPAPLSTLLYVEDNLPNVRLMQALVDRRPGWTMVHAGHGGLGLELATTLRPELVLLDLHLPDMNGLEILRRLRADPRTAHLRVVILSADANKHQVDRLLTAGADGYLTKPLDVAQTFALLDAQPRLQGVGRDDG